MTQQEFIEEVKRLSVADRIALLEAITHSLREDLETMVRNAAISNGETLEADDRSKRELRLAAVRRLRGILKTTENPPSDEELKEDYINHLVEKYS